MRRTAARFPGTTFVLDEYQLADLAQRLGGRLPGGSRVVRFNYAAGRGNDALARLLARLVSHRELAWPPGCGRVTPAPDAAADAPPDDLDAELGDLVLEQKKDGRIRFQHPPGGHDDRATALALAAWAEANVPSGGDFFHVGPPPWRS